MNETLDPYVQVPLLMDYIGRAANHGLTLSEKISTLPSPTLPCGIQANSMESMWIPHGFQVKCPKKEIFTPECMESLWNPCGIHPHSRFIPCRVQKEVFSDYLHGIHGIHGICMDSTWIPHGFQTKLPKENVCA